MDCLHNILFYFHLYFRQLIDYSLSLTYISVLCVYVVFIGSSFKEVFNNFSILHGVLPTLMYGTERWVWQKKQDSSINANK